MGMTGTVSIVIIGKDTRFLYFGAEAEARFSVSLTRAKAITVVVAPPSSTGQLGMLQTASFPCRLFSSQRMTRLTICSVCVRAWRTLMRLPGMAPIALDALLAGMSRPCDVCPSPDWALPQNKSRPLGLLLPGSRRV